MIHLKYNAEIFPLNFSERLKSNLKKFSDYKSIILRLKEITRRFGSEIEVIQYYLDSIWPNRKRGILLLKKIKKHNLEEFYEIRPILKENHFEYLLIEGRVLALHVVITKGNMLQIVGLGLVPNSSVQEYEVEISVELQWEARKKLEHSDLQFLRKLDSVQDHVAHPIEEWTKLIIWQEQQTIKNQRSFLFKNAKIGKRKELLLDITLKKPLPNYLLRAIIGNEFSVVPLKYSKDKRRFIPTEDNEKLDSAGFLIKIFKLKKSRRKKKETEVERKTEFIHYRVIIDIDEDYLQDITEDPRLLPETGFLVSSIAGDIAPLRNQIRALERFSAGKFYCARLATIIFEGSKAKIEKKILPNLSNTLQTLNERQKLAVKKALNTPELFLLQGPPGTGKTTVIAELAYQVTRKGGSILIASQTNLAVDNALDRLVNVSHLRPLRIGASHRVTKQGVQFLPENVIKRWLKAIIKETKEKIKLQQDNSTAESDFWISLQKKWVNKLSKPTTDDIAQFNTIYTKQANVFGMTCNEAGKTQFWASAFFKPFDIVVIDEVSKATLPELLMPMLLGKKIVLVGDHRQLPPLFKEVTFQETVEEGESIENEGFKKFEDLVTKSLYVTLFDQVSPILKETLTIQYRMHPEIMNAVNSFYEDSPLSCGLPNADDQRNHGINFANVSEDRHLIWIDSSYRTGNIPVYEKQAGTSKLNLFEVDLVIESLLYLEESLLEQGYSDKKLKEIGVISFYGAQLLEIRSVIRSLQLDGHFECMQIRTNTVDRFQGMERPIIILSMVRSKTGRVGDFVKRYQRINVAMSRAQELLIIIGAEKTFNGFNVEVNDKNSNLIKKPVYRTILNNIKNSNAFITAKAFRM